MKHKLPRRHSMDISNIVNRTFIVLAIIALVVLNTSETLMLSVSRSMAADSASSYFCKGDYYFQDNGSSMWLGNGAKILGLSGKVDKTDFQTIANGCHPVSREQLIASKITKDENGQKIENHRAGNDLTFSAPKAISIAYAAGVEDVKAAHDKAVQAVIRHIQEHYSQYRSPSGIQHADNLIAAKFDHITSRALDPQLHSHIFLINAVLTHEGDWKANETLNIFKDQKKLGLLYRQELANQLKILGYQIDYSDRKQMLYDIKGVDQANMDLFSKRRAAIEKQVAEWKNCNKFPDATDARLFEMANLNTRAAKDSSLTKNDIQTIWDKGFEEAGSSNRANFW